jgi:streptomycin 6-kinase
MGSSGTGSSSYSSVSLSLDDLASCPKDGPLGYTGVLEMAAADSSGLLSRAETLARDWQVVVERTLETQTSFLAFGSRDGQPVVLKVVRDKTDEWRSGEITAAFDGKGVVRVYEHTHGATLLERVNPGTCLASMSLGGRDDEATEILAEVIGTMSPRAPAVGVPTVQEWGGGLECYSASGDRQIPKDLVDAAGEVYSELFISQSRQRLLHGDLHHYNVLFDAQRGWLAIDPKGVIGELEYEIGAALRNPYEMPGLLAEPSAIARRVECFARKLNLDVRRTLAWAFAQAILSAAWAVEDGFTIGPKSPSMALANAIRPML